MSYESFRKRFRELTGQSPAHYLTAQVMSQACNLLYAGNLQIKEIAGELGFCDEYHFSKRFKQWYGQAPSHHASTGMKRS
jgi:AraC-like DNA-binding protein